MRHFVSALLSVVLCSLGFAQGTLVPPEEFRHRPNFRWDGYRLDSHVVNVTIKEGVAETRVEQMFANPNPYPLEAVYVFPIPAGANISRLSMIDGDKLMEGKIMPADQARQIYRDIVVHLRDPALLEYVGSRLVQLSIFPIPPNGKRKIVIKYSETLQREGGAYRYAYPFKLDGRSIKPPHLLSLSADIEMAQPIQTVYSPSHPGASVRPHGPNHATVSWELTDVWQPDDFQLLIRSGGDRIGLSMLPYKTGGDGYFLLFLSPRLQGAEAEISKSIVFLFDRTGSMSGEKIQQAKEALRSCVKRLRPMDRFELITFNDGQDPVFRRLVEASQANIDKAVRAVDAIEAEGGTNIQDAMELGLKTVKEGPANSFRAIVFLTDGRPTLGETEPNRIVSRVRDDNEGKDRVRIYDFGVGRDVDSVLLDKLAFDSGGDSNYVLEGEKIDPIVEGFFEKVSVPALSNIKLTFDGLDVYDVFPREPRDLFRGSAMVIAGRYRGGGHGTVTISGDSAQQRDGAHIEVDLSGWRDRDDFVPRIWAARKIANLMDQMRLSGKQDKELTDEVVRLSLEFGIITPMTSYLITEDRGVPPPRFFGRPGHARDGDMIGGNSDFTLAAPSDIVTGKASGALRKSGEGGGSGGYGGGMGGYGGGGGFGQPGTNETTRGPAAIADKVFYVVKGVWTDGKLDEKAKITKIKAFSDAHLSLIEKDKKFGQYSKLGEHFIVQLPGGAVEIGPDGKETLTSAELSALLKR